MVADNTHPLSDSPVSQKSAVVQFLRTLPEALEVWMKRGRERENTCHFDVDLSPVTSRLQTCNVIHFHGCLLLSLCLLRTPIGSEYTRCGR